MKHKRLYIFSLFLFSLFSCSSENIEVFSDLQGRIQNDGYFPLAPDNKWIYETLTGSIKDDGTIIYDNNKLNVESIISSTNLVETSDENKRFDYSFTPIDFGNKGGLLGSINQISKYNGEYEKKQLVFFSDVYNSGEPYIRFKLQLNDQKFLTDNPQIGEVISQKSGAYTSPGGAFEIEYIFTTEVVGFLDELPEKLTNHIGIDDHLREYKDILHTRDVLFLKKITAYENAGNRIKINATIHSNKESQLTLNNSDNDVSVNGIVFILGFIPAYSWSDGFGLRVHQLTQSFGLCEGEAKIKIDTVLKGGKIELIANQEIYNSDQYWVKGVGNIKNITTFKDVVAKINLENYLSTEPFVIDFVSNDPDCRNQSNKATINLQINTSINSLNLEVPLYFSNYGNLY